VVSRLIDSGSLAVTTGRSSRPCAAACIQAPKLLPKCSIRNAGSAAATSPIVSMPSAESFAAAFGPMPLTLRAASGQIRAGMSAWSRRVRPSGLSSSEAIFDSSLFGVMPIEQFRLVAVAHRGLQGHADALATVLVHAGRSAQVM
jgi:hypothetical protein